MIAAWLITLLAVHQEPGERVDAELARLDQAFVTAVDEGEPRDVVRVLVQKGDLQLQVTRYDQARETFREALDWLDEDADPNLWVEVLRGQANSAILTGAYAEAREALATADEHVARGVHECVRRSVDETRGLYYSLLGSYAEASRCYREAVAGLAPGQVPAFTWLNLARSLLDSGDWRAAWEAIQHALAGLGPAASPVVAGRVHLVMGEIEVRRGDLDAAEACYARCEDFLSDQPVAPLELELFQERAMLAHRRGRPEEVHRLYESALESMRATGDPNLFALALEKLQSLVLTFHSDAIHRHEELLAASLGSVTFPNLRAQVLHQLGNLAQLRGDWPRAAKLFRQALETYRQVPNATGEHGVLLNLATVARLQGDWRASCEAVASSHALAEHLGLSEVEGRGHLTLGLLHLNAGRVDPALVSLREGLRIFADSPDPTRRHGSRLALVEALIQAGEWAEAESLLDQVEEEAVAQEDRYWEARARGARGRIRQDQGHHREAEELVIAAIEVFRRYGFPEDELGLLGVLASSRLAAGDLVAVGRHLQRAEGLLSRSTLRSLTPLQFAQRRSCYPEWGDLAQSLSFQEIERSSGAARSAAFDTGFRRAAAWKGRALREQLWRRRGAPDPRSDRNQSTGVEDVQRRLLGPRDVLIELVERGALLSAYVIDPDHARTVDLGGLAELRGLANRFTDELSGGCDVERFLELGEPLFERLLRLHLPDLDTIETLWIVPSTSLSRLPFPALPVARREAAGYGGVLFLDDVVLVRTAPSVPFFMDWPAPSPADLSRPALVLAANRTSLAEDSARDPVLPCVCGRHSPVTTRDLRSIQSVNHEALAVAQVFASLAPGFSRQGLRDRLPRAQTGRLALRSQSLDVHVGPSATPGQLTGGRASEYGTIHIAAHGLADPEAPSRTGLVLSPGEGDDGFLGVDQILQLELSGPLVVLSACETGLGPVLAGEGSLSLAWAFLHAGARGAVASLWSVDDASTAWLMTDMTRRRLEGTVDPAAALRAARRAFREQRPGCPGDDRGVVSPERTTPVSTAVHPSEWAAFLYLGG